MNDTPRNVLYVSHTADLRGSAMSLRELMVNVDRGRWRPHALLSKHGPLEEVLTQAGIPFEVIAARGLFKFGRIAAARDYLRNHAIELVHLNSAVPFCRDVGIAARLAGLPVVWHIREDPQSKRVRRLGHWIGWLSQRIVVVSSDLEARFRATGKAVKVYNGVNLARFSPLGGDGRWRERLGINPEEFVFILVGTIEERKGQYLAIEAAASVVGRYRPFRLILVGEALNDVEQKRLDDVLARYPQIRPLVHCVGRQSQPEVAALLRTADCLMLPSAWEGFPRTVAEAMACGVPVIVTHVGELPQMVCDGTEGWFMSGVDARSAASAMARALTAPNAAEIGAQACRKAQIWSSEEYVRRIEEIYLGLLQADPLQNSSEPH